MAVEASEEEDDSPIVGINVTPLVDVVLVLLVVLMVAAPLLSAEVLQLDLPKASTGEEQQHLLAIELSPDGSTWVNQRAVTTDEQLRSAVRAAAGSNGDTRAVIRADGAVPHRRVVHIMDLLRSERIAKIAFATTAPTAADGPGGLL